MVVTTPAMPTRVLGHSSTPRSSATAGGAEDPRLPRASSISRGIGTARRITKRETRVACSPSRQRPARSGNSTGEADRSWTHTRRSFAEEQAAEQRRCWRGPASGPRTKAVAEASVRRVGLAAFVPEPEIPIDIKHLECPLRDPDESPEPDALLNRTRRAARRRPAEAARQAPAAGHQPVRVPGRCPAADRRCGCPGSSTRQVGRRAALAYNPRRSIRHALGQTAVRVNAALQRELAATLAAFEGAGRRHQPCRGHVVSRGMARQSLT